VKTPPPPITTLVNALFSRQVLPLLGVCGSLWEFVGVCGWLWVLVISLFSRQVLPLLGAWVFEEPALTKQVSKETYYRGKRDLCADFESLPADHACSLGGKGNDIELRRRREVEKLRMDQDGNLATH